MNKKSLMLLFSTALCGVNLSFAHEIETTEMVVEMQNETSVVAPCLAEDCKDVDVETDACCVEVMPAQEIIVETTEVSLTEEELPELTADEEQELEKLLAEFIKAQQEQEEALAAQEQE